MFETEIIINGETVKVYFIRGTNIKCPFNMNCKIGSIACHSCDRNMKGDYCLKI